jgi:site-specific recombinase XerD
MQPPNSIPRLELIAKCRTAFYSFKLSEQTVANHLKRMRLLLRFMEDRGIDHYTRSIGEEFCSFLKENLNYSPYYKKTHFDYIGLINAVAEGLSYKFRFKKRSDYTQPNTEFGNLVNELIAEMSRLRYSPITICQYKLHLKRFSIAMQLKGKAPNTFNRDDILNFMNVEKASYTQRLGILRHFLKFLFEHDHIKTELYKVLDGCKPSVKQKVISYYTPEEIRLIESSINRATAKGKRNYAMILLATRLGLRSSDIRRLQLGNIDWDRNVISLIQYKTNKQTELPLLSEVGDAIIDYLLHGRPKTNLKYVFLSLMQPYRMLGDSAFTGIVIRVIRDSRINTNGRHHGAHSLRHSLATTLMNNGTDLPVISETLGHKSTESTMYYLNVNISNLLECSHEIPSVPDLYYTQKGGLFYE